MDVAGCRPSCIHLLDHLRTRLPKGSPVESDAHSEICQVIDNTSWGGVLVGPHDEILTANSAARALGLVRGTRIEFGDLIDRVREVRREDVPFNGVVSRVPGPGAEAVELSVLLLPLEDDSIVVLAEDESASRRVDEVRRDFVANISHELKTPIGAIAILAETLEAAHDDPDQVLRFGRRLQAEASRLTELVAQIIDLSRLQSEDPVLQRELVEVSDIITEAFSRARAAASSRNVSLIRVGSPQGWVLGDRWKLIDAITNLVQNAIAYSDHNARVAVSVVKQLDGPDEFVEIKVADNGIGIKPEDQERIFERFYRVDYGRSRESGGTGLGLSIVRHIAMSHGGSIKVWSRPNQGSTFTFRLPAQPAPELIETELEEEIDL